jgi:hypothetical protein
MNLSVENNEQPLDLGIPCFQTNPVIRYGCYYAQAPTDQTVRVSSGVPNLPVPPMGQLVLPGCCSRRGKVRVHRSVRRNDHRPGCSIGTRWNTLELWKTTTKYPLGT